MTKQAIVILAGTEGHDNLGRMVNGLQTASEFAQDEEAELELIFDGAGTSWIPVLEDPDHDAHGLYQQLKGNSVVCDYCAGAFEVDAAVNEAGLERRDEHHGHPSMKSLVEDGFDVITF